MVGFAPTRPRRRTPPMEAERLNALDALIADLARRVIELRGYL
jgi:hypothetical protein